MAGRKTAAVEQGVQLMITGACATVYEAARLAGVSASSIHRDRDYLAWTAARNRNEKPVSGPEDYLLVSVHHTQRAHRYVTFWGPDNAGYRWALPWAGRYTEAQILAEMDYYHTGCDTIAVRASAIEPLAVSPRKGDIDGDAGPVVLNNAPTWRVLLANMIAPPPHAPKPEYRGARRHEVIV